MAGGGGVSASVRTESVLIHWGLTNAVRTDYRLVAFDCTPETSRILRFWASEEAKCGFERIWTVASRLLLRGRSNRRFFPSHLIVNLIVYLCAKFGALNPRNDEIRSGENRSQPHPQVLTPRYSIPLIFRLSDLVAMFPRASKTIMDNNLHVSSHSYASRPREIKRPRNHTSGGNFH